VDALNNLAWLLSLRRPETAREAVALIDRAVKARGGESPSLVDTRAVARIQLGQIDQAIKDLTVIRQQAPRNPSFAFHLAWAYQARGEGALARQQLQEAERIGLRPGNMDPLELAILRRIRESS
jgi:Flp pilus assembly protein TadD